MGATPFQTTLLGAALVRGLVEGAWTCNVALFDYVGEQTECMAMNCGSQLFPWRPLCITAWIVRVS